MGKGDWGLRPRAGELPPGAKASRPVAERRCFPKAAGTARVLPLLAKSCPQVQGRRGQRKPLQGQFLETAELPLGLRAT